MRRGEVWLAALDPVRGSEQAGTRPVLVLQTDPLNAFLRTVVVIPFTTDVEDVTLKEIPHGRSHHCRSHSRGDECRR